MKLRAVLPLDREGEGQFWVLDEDGVAILGPVRCRGEADSANAAKHSNVVEDPARVGGDHPYGMFRVKTVVRDPQPAHSYGPFFISLVPVSGQAWEAWVAGRRGIGIHGGDLGPGSTLRATFGCLRLDNETIEHVAKLLVAEQAAGREVWYECLPMTP